MKSRLIKVCSSKNILRLRETSHNYDCNVLVCFCFLLLLLLAFRIEHVQTGATDLEIPASCVVSDDDDDDDAGDGPGESSIPVDQTIDKSRPFTDVLDGDDPGARSNPVAQDVEMPETGSSDGRGASGGDVPQHVPVFVPHVNTEGHRHICNILLPVLYQVLVDPSFACHTPREHIRRACQSSMLYYNSALFVL